MELEFKITDLDELKPATVTFDYTNHEIKNVQVWIEDDNENLQCVTPLLNMAMTIFINDQCHNKLAHLLKQKKGEPANAS